MRIADCGIPIRRLSPDLERREKTIYARDPGVTVGTVRPTAEQSCRSSHLSADQNWNEPEDGEALLCGVLADVGLVAFVLALAGDSLSDSVPVLVDVVLVAGTLVSADDHLDVEVPVSAEEHPDGCFPVSADERLNAAVPVPAEEHPEGCFPAVADEDGVDDSVAAR
jgi:hypothetical protein